MADENLKSRLENLKKSGFFDDLIIRKGIEKEFFRTDNKGFISEKSHPQSLGSALTNRLITTDFAEAQVELVTPVFENTESLYDFLLSLHIFVAKNIHKDELLWPFSMPPKIQDESKINIGYYHKSNIGLLKHVYRRGLKVRYGATMQCVSGMHYNFSLHPRSLNNIVGSNDQKDIDETYLSLIRNFKRNFWFVLLEFGQTNVVDKSFVNNRDNNLSILNKSDLYLAKATSLRMSEIGYQSSAQKNLQIKYNSLDGFLKKIKNAITLPFEDFNKIGLLDEHDEYHQISDGIIQIENEYYDSIRPKRSALKGMRPYDLLKRYGIEYLEVRGIDLFPGDITGISKHHINFIDLIMIHSLVSPSPKISEEEKKCIDSNDNKVIYNGMDIDEEIIINNKKIKIQEQRAIMLNELKLVATYLKNKNEMHDAINFIMNGITREMSEQTFHDNGVCQAKENIKHLQSSDSIDLDRIREEAELSLNKLEKMKKNSKDEMNEYVRNYNSKL